MLAAATGCGDDPPAPEGRWWEKCYESFPEYEEDPVSDLIGRPVDEVQIPLGTVAEDGECHAGFLDLDIPRS